MSTAHNKFLFILAACSVANMACAQWTFTLDTTFRTEITQRNVNSLLVMPDGKLVASGIMRFPGEFDDQLLVRLNADGTRDEDFYNSALGSDRLQAWTPEKFYVNAGLVRRIWASSGNIDATFAVGAHVVPYFQGGGGGGSDYHVYPDGRVVISGSHTLRDSIRGFVGSYNLIWFTNTGYLDTTRTHRRANGLIWGFKELPDGKFICSCTCTQYEGQPVSRLFRVHADGSLDNSFQPGINWGNMFTYHPLPDGRVYVGGRYKRAAAPNDTLYLARFMPDGSLDPTFTPPQIAPATPPTTFGILVAHIHPWQNGQLIVTGQFGLVNSLLRSAIFMVDGSGALQDAFDDCGVGQFAWQNYTYASIVSVVEDAHGHLYICGGYTGYTDGTVNDPQQRFVSRLLVEQITTSATHIPDTEHFALYPNPAAAQVTFTWPQATTGTIAVRDLMGRTLARLPMGPGGTSNWDTRSVASGTYLVHYLVDGHLHHTGKLVIEQ